MPIGFATEHQVVIRPILPQNVNEPSGRNVQISTFEILSKYCVASGRRPVDEVAEVTSLQLSQIKGALN